MKLNLLKETDDAADGNKKITGIQSDFVERQANCKGGFAESGAGEKCVCV